MSKGSEQRGIDPQDVVPLRPFSKERVESLLALRAALMKPRYDLLRAADAIYELTYSNTYALMRLRWLTEPRQVTVLEEEALR